jgi:hypothetical protein
MMGKAEFVLVVSRLMGGAGAEGGGGGGAAGVAVVLLNEFRAA